MVLWALRRWRECCPPVPVETLMEQRAGGAAAPEQACTAGSFSYRGVAEKEVP